MRNPVPSIFLAWLFSACLIGGCGGDIHVAPTPGADASMGGGAENHEPRKPNWQDMPAQPAQPAEPESMGACDNPHDIEGLQKWKMDQLIYQCYGTCHSNQSPQSCLAECVVQSITGPDVTMECVGCYAEMAACTYGDAKCTEECNKDSSSMACMKCSCDMGCTALLGACSGTQMACPG